MSTVSEPDRVESADASQQEDTAKAVASQSQAKLGEVAARHTPVPEEQREPVLSLDGVTVSYSGAPAVCDVSMDVFRYQVTAFIGPSGCGKTTLLRSLNRMNDLITGATLPAITAANRFAYTLTLPAYSSVIASVPLTAPPTAADARDAPSISRRNGENR